MKKLIDIDTLSSYNKQLVYNMLSNESYIDYDKREKSYFLYILCNVLGSNDKLKVRLGRVSKERLAFLKRLGILFELRDRKNPKHILKYFLHKNYQKN